jgi:hypothetical protein
MVALRAAAITRDAAREAGAREPERMIVMTRMRRAHACE